MLNPDGVIVGNYRCSLTGHDLNRNYKLTLKESFPSIWHTKNMIKRLADELLSLLQSILDSSITLTFELMTRW